MRDALTHQRARVIVKQAAALTQVEYLKTWFLRDESATWEKQAIDLLDKSTARATALGMSDAEVDEEVANYLCFIGLSAIESSLKKEAL